MAHTDSEVIITNKEMATLGILSLIKDQRMKKQGTAKLGLPLNEK